jgi:hypothetical protein
MAKGWFNTSPLIEDHQLKTKKVVLDINAGTSGFNCSNIGAISVTATDAAAGEYDIDCTELGDVYRAWEVRVISDTDTSVISTSISSNVLTISVNSGDDLSATHQDLVIEVTYELLK